MANSVSLCPVRSASVMYVESLTAAAAAGSIEAWPILVALMEGRPIPLASQDRSAIATNIRRAHAALESRLCPGRPKRRRMWLCLIGPAYSNGLCVLCGVPVHSRLRCNGGHCGEASRGPLPSVSTQALLRA